MERVMRIETSALYWIAALVLPAALDAQTIPTVRRPEPIAPAEVTAANDSATRVVEQLGVEKASMTLDAAPTLTADPAANKQAVTRGVAAKIIANVKSNKNNWCNDENDGVHWCGVEIDTSRAHVASRKFWGQTDAGGFTAVKMLNLQGLGDKQAQSVYVELVSDLWNGWRVGLGGVFADKDTVAGTGAKSDKGKAQQFLNGGGPALLTIARPIVVVNFAGTRTIALLRGQAAFTAPGAEKETSDSTKYADLGVDVQSRIDGDLKKIGGIATAHIGRVIGGGAFYRALETSGSFTTAHVSLGITIENAVRVSWTKFVLGPSKLVDQNDLITVNFVR
jgi:hypothetical protein